MLILRLYTFNAHHALLHIDTLETHTHTHTHTLETHTHTHTTRTTIL